MRKYTSVSSTTGKEYLGLGIRSSLLFSFCSPNPMRRYHVFSSSDEVFPIMEYTGTLGECRYPTGRGMHTINSACEFDGPKSCFGQHSTGAPSHLEHSTPFPIRACMCASWLSVLGFQSAHDIHPAAITVSTWLRDPDSRSPWLPIFVHRMCLPSTPIRRN